MRTLRIPTFVKQGVPQKSFLGSLLYLVNTNGIFSNAESLGKLISHSDDSALTENWPSETVDLNHGQTLLASNKIDLNYTQSLFVNFEKWSKLKQNSDFGEEIIASCVSSKYMRN